MTAVSTHEAGEPQHQRGSIWNSALMYVLLPLVLMLVFRKKNTDVRETDGQQIENFAVTDTNTPYTPFARKGDLYTVSVTSPGNDAFPGDVFTDLILDDGEEISRHYHLNLLTCASRNRTLDLRILMRIGEEEYSQDFSLLRFLPPHPTGQKKNLFANEVGVENNASSIEDAQQTSLWKAYFQPVLTLNPIIDFSSPLPPPMRPHYRLDNLTQKYLPLLYINNFWVLRDHLVEVNATTAVSLFNFTINISPQPLWKFALIVNFEQSMKQQQDMGLMRSEDADETKRIFLETNPYLLALTCVVTVLHMLFEYLAFSNDVKFWRRRKDFQGLSLRTVLMNCYFQTVIFLYLCDNDETSWSILIPSGIGVLVEYWKLAQTTRLVHDTDGWWRVKFGEGYDRRTRKHDDLAVRYLMYSMTPVLLGYTTYSALFDTHKGWYSFFIGTQVRFIYFFGFAMMTPQIFINYKMKTVTQLPWRTFVYRSLNTVIDDLFAFIVKMPWLHRLACFRDDVVFLILLYQRWIYPVDMRRSEVSDGDNDEEEKVGKEKEEKCVEGQNGDNEAVRKPDENVEPERTSLDEKKNR